ncbi:MauE/DoxX family redox-associated membrane protein [Streptomyces sp. NPDC091292]|uniref:MauE/DoxX family redox-associated membrane protein n=1 Tax=Streptomyces sp. NPDC091292 TaxID=3365991 RepID=UPI003807F56C
MDHVLISCRVFLGLVFVLSFTGKVRGRAAYRAFRDSVRELAPWLPGGGAALTAAAVTVLAAESVSVVLLAVPSTGSALAGFLLATGLLGAFTVAIAGTVRRGDRVACRCFGAASSAPVGAAQLVRNGLLLAGALTGVCAALTGGGPGVPLAGAAVALVFGAAAAGLVLLTDDLSQLLRPLGHHS